MLKDPETRSVVVDLIPEAQSDQRATRHIPHSPEIQREQHDDEHGLHKPARNGNEDGGSDLHRLARASMQQ